MRISASGIRFAFQKPGSGLCDKKNTPAIHFITTTL
jgi:hypothetical protein